MKSRITQILRGTIEYEKPVLSFGMDQITGTLLPGKKMSLEVIVTSENNVSMHLFFYSHSARVRVIQPLCYGKSCKLTLEINTVGCVPSDKIEGDIDVLYNGGQTKLPFSFKVGISGSEVLSDIHDLDEFYEFAKDEYEEAVRVFSWRDFTEVPFMQSMEMQAKYRLYYSQQAEDSGLSSFLSSCGYEAFVRTEEEQVEGVYQQERERSTSFLSQERRKEYRVLSLLTRFDVLHRFFQSEEISSMSSEFENLMLDYPSDILVHLVYIYYHIQCGNLAIARNELIQVQNQVQKERMEKRELYCLFVYLVGVLQQDEKRIEMAWKLTHKYFTENSTGFLMNYLEYRMNPVYREDLEKASQFLKQLYQKGFRSSLLIMENALLFKNGVIESPVLSDFELQTALFGLRFSSLSERRLFELLSKELKDPRHLNLYMQVLKLSYKTLGNEELLMAICNIYLQSGKHGKRYFKWYHLAYQNNIKLPGIYEYYIASYTKDTGVEIPEEMIRYFGIRPENSSIPLDLLYNTVLEKYKEDSEIVEMYQERITQFALSKLKTEEYTAALLPIFNEVLSEEYVNEESAESLLQLFYLYHVKTSYVGAKNLVVYYPAIQKSLVYPLSDGEAVIPVYLKNSEIAVENERGQILYDARLQVEKKFEDSALKEKCELFVKDYLMQKLSIAESITEKGIQTEEELQLIVELINQKKVEAFYRARLYESIVDMSLRQDMRHIDTSEFLMTAEFTAFTPEYQSKFLMSLIRRGYYKEAYERILEYGFDRIDDESLVSLAEYMMKLPVVQGDRTMISMCYRLYRSGSASTAIYSFLAAYFTGNSQEMSGIVKVLRKRRQPTVDLVERTIIASIYVNDLKDLDTLFEIYTGENKQDDKLKNAYLILKSHDYFMNHKRLTQACVKELKKSVFMLPRVGILACLTFLAENVNNLSMDEVMLSEQLLKKAVDEGIVLECFSKFYGHVHLPLELEGRVFVEYRTEDASEVAASGMILPLRKYFHRTLNLIYPGVYARSFILYKREWIQFEFSVHKKNGVVMNVESDVIAQEADPIIRGSRYEDIQHLSKMASRQDLRSSAELLRSLVLKDQMIEDIFSNQ